MCVVLPIWPDSQVTDKTLADNICKLVLLQLTSICGGGGEQKKCIFSCWSRVKFAIDD